MMFGTQGPSVVEGVKPLRGNGTFWDCITVLDVRKRACRLGTHTAGWAGGTIKVFLLLLWGFI